MKMKRILQVIAVLCVLYIGVVFLTTVRSTSASNTSQQSGRAEAFAAQADWWDAGWDYRVLVTVNAGGIARQDKPAEANLNFTESLNAMGKSGDVDLDSIRVTEVDAGDNLLDAAVPFQFDPASDYDAASNAAGVLTFMMKDSTAAAATRRYHVYFDLTAKGIAPASVTPMIATTDNIQWEGYSSIRIETPNGTYYYQKPGGGFASLKDAGDNDWIGWNASTTPTGAAGDYRGIPNMVPPDSGGFFHPGRPTATTTLVHSGPLKATFISTNNAITNPINVAQGQWQVMWEVFPSYARMTVIKAPAATTYWFLYEGTPGGLLEPAKDFLILSDGTKKYLSQPLLGDIPNEEWIFFGDPDADRSIYLAHHVDDDKEDAYWTMNNLMTVFGFGRREPSTVTADLLGAGRQLTIGLVDSTNYDSVRPVVHNAYKDLSVTVGTAEEVPPATSTSTQTQVPIVSSTPTIIYDNEVFGPVIFGGEEGPIPVTSTTTAIPTATPTGTPTSTSTPSVTPTPITPTPVTPTATPTKKPPPPNLPTEMMIFDWHQPVTKDQRGFPWNLPPMESANGDWTDPVNFAEGTLYFRATISGMPTDQLVKLQFCIWQKKVVDDGEYLEICGEMANFNVTSGGDPVTVHWEHSIPTMYQISEDPIDWTRPRHIYGVAIKNKNEMPVSDYVLDWISYDDEENVLWNGEYPDEWYPMDMQFTVVVVEAGKQFSGWWNYP